jgi:ubiquinone/menaquinone biosynthesis C-methylase UbiE
MNIDQQVAAHYTPGMLEERISGALRSTGKSLDQLSSRAFEALDNFHVGGREATDSLASLMGVQPGMHLLDVGCGIGGPARYFAERGCQVTGIDLSAEFVRVGERLTRLLRLDQVVKFRQASALNLPFDSGTFDGAYEIHAGMNMADKGGVFREVARVLKPGARCAIFDVVRSGDAPFEFPVPWALGPETSFVSSAEDYRQALQAAGFHMDCERSRRQFAIEFMQKVMAQGAAAKPVLGVHLLMGEHAPVMLKNVMAAIGSGALDPVEIVATAG